jgi:hypothetical protein
MPIVRDHDQFYTCESTASFCVEKLLSLPPALTPNAWFLEPSAGAGAFLQLLPAGRRAGFDIEPRHPEISHQDFLDYDYVAEPGRAPVIVAGNPPFGRNSSLAMKFVNKAATFADIVAFILPKTFQKDSTVRRLNAHLHLREEHELPPFSFVFEGKPWDVPCVFQIWERRLERRVDPVRLCTHPDFSFVKRSSADFAVRRVGRSAGIVLREFATYSKFNHHFVKAADPERVIAVLNSIDWSEVRQQTAGVPCVGKEELVRRYAEKLLQNEASSGA